MLLKIFVFIASSVLQCRKFESIQLISQHRTVVRNFQNKANFEIIGFASDSSDTDLRDIDLLDEEKLCM